jgi:hypothetical protein
MKFHRTSPTPLPRIVMRTSVSVLALFSAVVIASPAGATRLAGEFMALGAGARALGMGGAFAAVADDASAVYWNPAGIAGVQRRQALAMHAEQFGDLVNYNFGSYVQPTSLVDPARKPAWGVGLIHLGSPDQPVNNTYTPVDTDGDGIPEYFEAPDGTRVYPDAYDSAFARESNNSFAGIGTIAVETKHGQIGGSLKLIYENYIAGESSMGIGIDLGFLRRNFLTRNLSVGAKLQDATGTYISWSTGTNEFILPMLKVGGAYKLVSTGFNGAVLLAVDADVFFDDRRQASQFWSETVSADLHVGLELSFQDHVMIRGGLDGEDLDGGVKETAGAGVYFGMFGLDYAYLKHDAFDASHRVSILASF